VLDITIGWAVALGAPMLALHTLAVLLARALRTYSRSILEEVCERHGRPRRADEIAHQDERTERGVEAVEVLTGLALAVVLGAFAARRPPSLTTDALVALGLTIWTLTHIGAGVIGRVHAELVLDRFWPAASTLRTLTTPLINLVRGFEILAYRSSPRSRLLPRPASVEVEFPATSEAEEHTEADLPEPIREMLEHVIEFAGRDVVEAMTPRSAMFTLPSTVTAAAAHRAFVETGYSRIPLHGAGRDDIVGILYAKDLMAQWLATPDPAAIHPRAVAKPPMFVPETKNAAELLDEFRTQRIQIAIVVDEYGTVSGLITLEDLLEQVVGPIHDEFDPQAPADSVVPVGDGCYEFEATLSVEDLNERLGLRLPTDAAYQTVGGLAFTELGRVPEPGATFRCDGVEFTVVEVVDHSIRRLRINLQPAPEPPVEGLVDDGRN
jgi:CBS domain containing-hemolysin-like protein